MTTTKRYAEAFRVAVDEAGGARAFSKIGATYRRALVAQAILLSVYAQDDSIDAATIRELTNNLCESYFDDPALRD